MSRQNDQWEPQPRQFTGKDQESENGKRKRISRDQAKKTGKQTLKCTQCSKEYLSYPALYKHCKDKHPQIKITSKNVQKQNDHLPIQKMKTLLKETSNFKNQQTERSLITRVQKCISRIVQQCESFYPNLSKNLGKFSNNFTKVEEIKLASKDLTILKNIDKDIFQNIEVFKEIDGKFSKISFGTQIVAFFANSRIANQIYLQLLCIPLYENQQQNAVKQVQKIWGRSLNWSWLNNEWKIWKRQAAELQSYQNE